MITDATGAPISNYVSSGAKFEVSSGKQVATFELKAGVKLKKDSNEKKQTAVWKTWKRLQLLPSKREL